ncbi:hypothetical protein RND71_039632 [Anisodus tanguticus]|uniref:Uncharacterized protein n=1 Tax=Anisodus tanguticus TaxID=243964 RepID=A0AAE1QXJ0_9SOLA|nr:hypothetical protein RND71_039632 [Anisodus tanguticus]
MALALISLGSAEVPPPPYQVQIVPKDKTRNKKYNKQAKTLHGLLILVPDALLSALIHPPLIMTVCRWFTDVPEYIEVKRIKEIHFDENLRNLILTTQNDGPSKWAPTDKTERSSKKVTRPCEKKEITGYNVNNMFAINLLQIQLQFIFIINGKSKFISMASDPRGFQV